MSAGVRKSFGRCWQVLASCMLRTGPCGHDILTLWQYLLPVWQHPTSVAAPPNYVVAYPNYWQHIFTIQQHVQTIQQGILTLRLHPHFGAVYPSSEGAYPHFGAAYGAAYPDSGAKYHQSLGPHPTSMCVVHTSPNCVLVAELVAASNAYQCIGPSAAEDEVKKK